MATAKKAGAKKAGGTKKTAAKSGCKTMKKKCK